MMEDEPDKITKKHIAMAKIISITRIVCIRPKGRTQCIFPLPNIAVCMYIYIDTKFSYDNNVYFLYSVNIGN